MLLRKFYSVPTDVFIFLFNAYCTSFYGSDLWADRQRCSKVFKAAGVAYHSALKKILNVPRYFNNHFVCDQLNMFTFENFINFKIIRFLYWLFKCRGPCFYLYRYYFFKFFVF